MILLFAFIYLFGIVYCSATDDLPTILKLSVNSTEPIGKPIASLTRLSSKLLLKPPFYVVSIAPEDPELFKKFIDVDLDNGDIKLNSKVNNTQNSLFKFSVLSINDGTAVIVVINVNFDNQITSTTINTITNSSTMTASASTKKSLTNYATKSITTGYNQACFNLKTVESANRFDGYLTDINEFIESNMPINRLIDSCIYLEDTRKIFVNDKKHECENKRNLNDLLSIMMKTSSDIFYEDWIGLILFFCNQFDRLTPSFVYLNSKSIDEYLDTKHVFNKNLNNPESLHKNQMEKFNLLFTQSEQSLLNVSLKCQKNLFDYRFNFNLKINDAKILDFVYLDLNSIEHLKPITNLSFIRLLEKFNKQTAAGILITSISTKNSVNDKLNCDLELKRFEFESTVSSRSTVTVIDSFNISSNTLNGLDLVNWESTRKSNKLDKEVIINKQTTKPSKTNSIASVQSKSFDTAETDFDRNIVDKNRFLTLNQIIFVVVIGLIIIILVIILILTFFIHKRTSFDSLSKYAIPKQASSNSVNKKRRSRLIDEASPNATNKKCFKYNIINILSGYFASKNKNLDESNARRILSYNDSTCSANLTAHMRRVNSDKSRSNQLNNNLIYSSSDNPNTHYLRPIINLFASMFNSTSDINIKQIQPRSVQSLETNLAIRNSLESYNSNTITTLKTRISTIENLDVNHHQIDNNKEFALSKSYLNNIGINFMDNYKLSVNKSSDELNNRRDLLDQAAQSASFWSDKIPTINNDNQNYMTFNKFFNRMNGVDSLKSLDTRSEYMEICFNTWYNLLDWVPEYTSVSNVLEDLALLSENTN